MGKEITKLGATMRNLDGDNASIEVQIQGDMNSLLNAYEKITVGLFQQIFDEVGKGLGQGIYAMVQTRALAELGIDVDEESEERAKKIARSAEMRDAFKDVVGKTFTVADEGKRGDEE